MFSPSWEGDSCEGSVILYEGSDRSRAIEAWHKACSDINPSCEIIVRGRETEHYDRKEAKAKLLEELYEEDDPSLETWVFEDGFMVFGEVGSLSGYEEYVISEALAHGKVDHKMFYRASGAEWLYDVVENWERNTP